MRRLIILLILVLTIVSLGCIQLPTQQQNIQTAQQTTANLWGSEKFSSNVMDYNSVNFIEYYVTTNPTGDITSKPFNMMPLSVSQATLIQDENYPYGEPLTITLAFRINAPNTPKGITIECTLHRNCFLGCTDDITNKPTAKCDENSYCYKPYTNVVVYSDTLNTKQDTLVVLYYLDCELKGLTAYKYWIVGSKESLKDLAKNVETLNSLIKSLIKKYVDVNHPLGLGPLQFQFYNQPNYLANALGLDGNIFIPIGENKKHIFQLFLRFANVMEKNSLWNIGVYGNKYTILNSIIEKQFDLNSKKELNPGITFDLGTPNHVSAYCDKYFGDNDCIANKLKLNKLMPTTNMFVTLDIYNVQVNRNTKDKILVLTYISYNYEVRIPLALIKIKTKKLE